MTGEANTWVAGSAGNWNVDENWSLGHVPTSTEVATFDNTSDNNCAINAAPDVYGINLATGYDGTATQGSVDIALGAGGYAQAAGTFTGNTGKTVTCAGAVNKTGGTLTDGKTRLVLTTDDIAITSNNNVQFHTLIVNGNTSLSSTSTFIVTGSAGAGELTTSSGKTLTIGTGATLRFDHSCQTFTNSGAIVGAGTMDFKLHGENRTLSLGTISAPVTIGSYSSMTGSRSLILGDSPYLGNVTVASSHATYTCTVDMAGKTLSATAITVSTRAVLTNSGAAAACTVSGALTVSGASSVVSGNIVLTYGTYVQSNGAATQVENWSGGAVTASGGTLTGAGSASVTLTSSGDVNLTGATVTADKLNLVMTGAGKTLTTTATLFGLKASAAPVNVAASCGITAGAGSHLTVDSGAFLNIASTKVLTLPMYAAGAVLVPNGIIGGAGTLAITMSDGDISSRLGNILCPLTIASINTAAANRKLTVLDNPSLAAVTVSSSDDDKTTTLDFAGRSANLNGAVTVGTRGNILWGEGVHHLGGNLDTSAGATNFETSQIVFTKSSTLKTAAEQPLYDMLIAPNVITTLGSDVTVSHTYANGGTLIPGEFALTASGSSYDKVFLPTELRANIGPLLYPTGKRFMRRLERVQ